MEWHIGCSGFHYKEWKDVFYPPNMPSNKWFEYYGEKFNTLELNVTFYKFPQLSFLENWYATSPDSFIFSVKVPRLITHYKKFRETEDLLKDFYTTIRQGLKDKLGGVLFQLPPQTAFNTELLEHIIGSLDHSFENVIEFRHGSWWREDVMKRLMQNKISFCGMSYPRLPEDVIINTDIVYYRFHGIPDLYRSEYSLEQLDRVADVILKNKKVKKAYIYFNNTAGEAAIRNANYMNALVSMLKQ
ncbi:MAG: DUF72 domain-containing protein [Chitinophagaceae bacterium]